MGVETMKTPSTWTYLGFRTPPYGGPETPTLTVIASLLGKGTSSRLYRALKEKENLVTDLSADYEIRKDPGMFTVSTQMPPANEAKVFALVRDEFSRLANEPVPAAELSRVKAALVNDYVFAAQTPFHRAGRLCLFTLMSDASVAGLWPRLIESVTAEDIRRVAATTFAPDRASYSVVVPPTRRAAPVRGRARDDGAMDGRVARRPLPRRARPPRPPRARRCFPTGPLLLSEDHAAPIMWRSRPSRAAGSGSSPRSSPA